VRTTATLRSTATVNCDSVSVLVTEMSLRTWRVTTSTRGHGGCLLLLQYYVPVRPLPAAALMLLLLSSSLPSSPVTGLVSPVPTPHGSSFTLQQPTVCIMCDVPSTVVFCSASVECFPGMTSKFFLEPSLTVLVAPIITRTIIQFMFHICCISVHTLLYFILASFLYPFAQHFCPQVLPHLSVCKFSLFCF